jgi:hypothetical protein
LSNGTFPKIINDSPEPLIEAIFDKHGSAILLSAAESTSDRPVSPPAPQINYLHDILPPTQAALW